MLPATKTLRDRDGGANATRLVAVLALLAWGLACYDLAGRSLWLDESYSMLRVNGTWRENLNNIVMVWNTLTIDTQPQLYFLLLKAWVGLVGYHEFGLKIFSAFWAAAAPPLAFQLARMLFSRRAALLAALFVAIAPTVNWYAQEVRMYSLVFDLGVAMDIAMLWLLDPDGKRRPRRMVTWLLVSVAGVLTNYSLLSLFAAHALVLVASLLLVRGKSAQRYARAILLFAAVSAAVSAIAFAAFDVRGTLERVLFSSTELRFSFVPLSDMLRSMLEGTWFGVNVPLDPFNPIAWVFGAWFVAALALVTLRWRGQLPAWRDALLRGSALLAMSVAPVVIWHLLSYIKPNFYGVRHLIFILPSVFVVAAAGTDALLGAGSRVWRAVVGPLAVLAQLASLVFGTTSNFVNTQTRQDDWRSLANFIRENFGNDDVVVLNPGTPNATLDLYLRDVPVRITQPSAISGSQGVSARNVWYVNTGAETVESIRKAVLPLAGLPLIDRKDFNGRSTSIQLLRFDARPEHVELAGLPAAAQRLAPARGEYPGIAAYEIRAGNPYATSPNARLRLYWQPGTREAAAPLDVQVRIKSDSGQEWFFWNAAVRPEFGPDPRALAVTDRLINIPIGLPPLRYHAEIDVRLVAGKDVIQHSEAGLADGSYRCCLRFDAWGAAGPGRPLMRTTDVALSSALFPSSIQRGQILPIALTWLPIADRPAGWKQVLRLRSLLGNALTSPPVGMEQAEYPPDQWRAGAPIRTLQTLTVGYGVPAGWYRLLLDRERDGARVDTTELGWLRVDDYPFVAAPKSAPVPVHANADGLELLGYGPGGALQRGQLVNIRTYWRVTAPPARDGVIFLHLVRSAGSAPIAQDDNVPESGQRSTLSYRTGEGIILSHRLVVPMDAPPGEYRLYAGVYDRQSGVRWPAMKDGAAAQDDLIFLGLVQVEAGP